MEILIAFEVEKKRKIRKMGGGWFDDEGECGGSGAKNTASSIHITL